MHQFLVIYAWFPLASLLGMLLLVARIYQKFSGQRTYYWLFLVPVVLFGVAAVRDAGSPSQPDVLVALLSFSGGVVLMGLSLLLAYLMLSNKTETL